MKLFEIISCRCSRLNKNIICNPIDKFQIANMGLIRCDYKNGCDEVFGFF